MVLGLFGGKPKTYDKPSEAICTTDALKASATHNLEAHVKYIDVRVASGDDSYVLHHVNSALLGWSIEIETSSGQDSAVVVNALKAIMGGRVETRQVGNKTKTVISPQGKVSLSELVGFIEAYSSKFQDAVSVTGYRLENLPNSLYKKVEKAGLPLQEAKP